MTENPLIVIVIVIVIIMWLIAVENYNYFCN